MTVRWRWHLLLDNLPSYGGLPAPFPAGAPPCQVVGRPLTACLRVGLTLLKQFDMINSS